MHHLALEHERSTLVTGLVSAEGERVPFVKVVNTKTAEVEQWLLTVQDFMLDNLKRRMKEGKKDYEVTERAEWVLRHPGQVVSTVSQIYWTGQTETSLYNL